MWQAISRLLSEQLGEGEIELRNELPGEKSMPHGICAMQDVTFSSNVMKGNCFPVLPPKPTNWSYCRVVKPSPCLRFGQLALTVTTVFW